MTSSTSQPSIADAARSMDSLGVVSSSARSTVARSTDTAVNGPTSETPILPDSKALSYHQQGDDVGAFASSHSRSTAPGKDVAPSGPPSTLHNDQKHIPNLPAETIFQIALHLVSNSTAPLPYGTDVRPSIFPCKHSFPPYTALSPTSSDLSALLSLSASTRSFRNTLVPLIWHTIVIRTPQHLPRLAALLQSYDTLNVRSTSTQRTRSSFREVGGLRHPLPHIRSIVVSIPDKYMDLDQSYLLTLLRSMDLPHTQQLEHLYWSAEAVPIPAVWPLVAPSLRSLELDGRTFYQGHKGMAGLERLESFKMVGYESTLLPSGVVAMFQAQSWTGGKQRREEVRELPEGAEAEERRDRGLSPLVELQSSVGKSQRQARHLYLDPRPPSTPSLSPSLLATKHTNIAHLSLSTSKTSLFHQPSLTTALVGLTHLDIFPITPEPPLASSLVAAASTLTHLRLVLDISGAFANYNRLWAELTGRLPQLEWLQVDPMPQQNTAPSFWDFVEQAKRLKWINGKHVETFPPCFGDFDPGNPSGALPF